VEGKDRGASEMTSLDGGRERDNGPAIRVHLVLMWISLVERTKDTVSKERGHCTSQSALRAAMRRYIGESRVVSGNVQT